MKGSRTTIQRIAITDVIGLLLLVFFLGSCSSALQEAPVNKIDTHLGKVRVGISQEPGRVINSATAKALVVDYEVVVYNDSTVSSLILGNTASFVEFSLPAGSYKVLVLAGAESSYSSWRMLVGSGVSSSVSVVDGKSTNVSVILNPAYCDVTLDKSTIQQGDILTLTMTAQTGCSVVTMSGSGHWATFSGVDKDLGLGGSGLVSSTTSFTAPQTLGDMKASYKSGYVTLEDSSIGFI